MARKKQMFCPTVSASVGACARALLRSIAVAATIALAIPASGGAAELPKVGPGWAKPQTLLDPDRYAFLTGLATDGRGTVIASWDAGTPIAEALAAGPRAEAAVQPERSQVSIKERGSRRFAPAITLSQAESDCTQVAMHADGSGIVVWRTERETRIAEYHPGKGLGAQRPVGPAGCPQLRAARSGFAMLTWHLFDPDTQESRIVASLREPGGEFEAPRLIARGEGLHAESAVNSAGHAIVVWEDEQDHPLIARVRGPGGEFGPRETVPGTSWATHGVHVAVDADGTTLVIKGGGRGLQPRLRASYRPADGAFSRAEEITTRGFGAFAYLATDERGRAIAVWSDFSGRRLGVQAAVKPRGERFKRPRRISRPGHSVSAEGLAMNARGDALVVMNRSRRFDRTFVDAAYRPIGGGWQRQRRVSRRSDSRAQFLLTRAALGEEGQGYVAWNREGRFGESGVRVARRDP